ncbi:SGNH/GDSL hydrolase family protein [Puniceicoccus vermicola]|uniref:SGNH/GDSL hydrolase family protein n=2 Tax=Puniceicoccus vermicola TaxID=388746 RepID=A0A7X1B1E6_9BACT|nr:SGNH/GDSL hydrolase family protein [Puniceicoccus vermicola]
MILQAENTVPSLVFIGDPVKIWVDGFEGQYSAEITTFSADGAVEKETDSLDFQEGVAFWTPRTEGIYRIRVGDRELRGMAMNLPPPLNEEALLEQLPRQGQRLLAGDRFTILAMGDSVTATGDYPTMLAMMLRRATGNQQVSVIERAYPGRSNDASVRNFARDTKGVDPNLAVIMYGLNDQGARVPLPAYLEQTEWLVDHLREEFDADVILLDPTPDTGIVLPDRSGQMIEPSKIFRTQTYSAARRDLAQEIGVPVADTFEALWGEGGESLLAVGEGLWPMFPLHYSKPFTSLIENGGKGDTIHPNALGHLALARAVFDRINGFSEPGRLELSGQTRWVDGGVETEILARNLTPENLSGVLRFYPIPQESVAGEEPYEIASGNSARFVFRWPGIEGPEDLLMPGIEQVFRQPGPYVVILDQWRDGNQARGVHVPWSPTLDFPLQRYVTDAGVMEVSLLVGDEERKVFVTIPEEEPVGRIPLQEKIQVGAETTWAVGELAYTRFGGATSMEATVDGNLDEWSDAFWVPVGERIQARWTSGPRDFRERVEDCNLEWSFAAGEEGLYLAFRGTGNTRADQFAVYFDPRSPEELGTAGPYTWVGGSFAKDGKLTVRAGDSSEATSGIQFDYQEERGRLSGEIFVPYEFLNTSAWPESGDLGLSIVWTHRIEGRKPTFLMWAEDGHPWNTRWYGVVRLDPEGSLPYRVRVK